MAAARIERSGLISAPMPSEREYARRFAAEHEHFVADLGFWRTAAERLGGPVLDVGCATGRVAMVLARDGHEVWAVDASRPMLDELEARLADEPAEVRARVRTVHARMQDITLRSSFPMVMVAMNTLQLLVTPADRDAGMRALAEHVAPGGELLLDVARLDLAEVRAAVGTSVPITAHRRAGGVLQVQVARYEALCERTRTLEFSIHVREAEPGGLPAAYVRRHTIHVYEAGEVEALARAVGLEVLEVTGDFAGGAADIDSDHHVYRMGRPAAAAPWGRP